MCVSGVATGDQRLFGSKHKEKYLIYVKNLQFLVANDFTGYLPVPQSLVLKEKSLSIPTTRDTRNIPATRDKSRQSAIASRQSLP